MLLLVVDPRGLMLSCYGCVGSVPCTVRAALHGSLLGVTPSRLRLTPQALETYAAERLPRVRDMWLRPGGAPTPPNRPAAIRAASFTPLGAGPHSGKSRPLQQQAAAA